MPDSLVYLTPNTAEPFTTSEVIAERANVKHHAIQQLITRYEKDFREMGYVAFEMRAVKTPQQRELSISKSTASTSSKRLCS